MKKILIYENTYWWENLYDIERDVGEAFDQDLNPNMKTIDDEFNGVMKITIEYIDEYKE